MKRRPSPALLISILALFVALSGSAYAAVKINGKDINKGTVTSKQIKDRSIKKVDLASDALIAGPKGDPGTNGTDGLSVLEGTLPSGKTIKRNWSVAASNGSAAVQTYYFNEPFPVRIPGLDSAKINFNGTAAAADDEDATCTGTVSAPTPPPGKVCIYPSLQSYYNTANSLTASAATVSDAGFNTALTLDPGESFSGYGLWVYTAP